MKRVIERCATCGVEHEVRVEECEACGGALRYWCRSHSGTIGWLESPECRGCAEEKARPKPRPAPARPPARPAAAAPWRRVSAPVHHPVPPVSGAAKPGRREPVYAPMPAHEWVERHVRATLGAMLWTTIVCVILISGWTLSNAVQRSMDLSDALVAGVIVGVMFGVLLGMGTAGVRLLWLKRTGGPLDARYRP